MTPAELNGASKKSREALASMGSKVQWVQSYVTDDKLYCVYVAESEDAVREHADCGGFPANKITRVAAVIDPSTGE
jgi:hypothetical protein